MRKNKAKIHSESGHTVPANGTNSVTRERNNLRRP